MTLGIDIGGTYLRYELRKKNICSKKASLSSKEIGLNAFLEQILEKNKNIDTVYISYAGQVQDGVILSAPNIKIDKHEIKKHIESKYDVQLMIQNDLSCAIMAEAAFYKSNNICAIYIGTGLGLGTISSSTLISGYKNIATELGHIPYKVSPFICSCGKSNCIELFCSGKGVMQWKQYYKLDQKMTLLDLKNSNEKNAKKIYEQFLEAFFYALGTTITLFNPEVLVLGGGILMNNKDILDAVKLNMHKYAMPLSLKNLRILNTQLENASLEGAFLLKDANA